MQLIVNGQDVPWTEAYLDWSLFKSFATLTVATDFISMTSEYEFKTNDFSVKLKPLKLGYNENSNTILTLVSSKYYDTIGALYGPYEGTTNVKELFQTLGLTVSMGFQTQNTQWCIPKVSLTEIIEIVKKYAAPSNKQGLFITSFLDGNLIAGCLSDIINATNAVTIDYTQRSNLASITWIGEFPGKYEISHFDKDGLHKIDYEIKKGYGQSAITLFDSADKSLDMIKQQLNNYFWNKYYTSWQLKVSANGPFEVVPGMAVVPKGYAVPFICTSVRKRFNPQAIVESYATLCRPIK